MNTLMIVNIFNAENLVKNKTQKKKKNEIFSQIFLFVTLGMIRNSGE